ncbi:MAG: hypothetical protein DRR04_04645 [Gammaproteobacteria bacterium]|nr:MAG: hypothetical protein DRQ97_07610 [Gammaproteobacteria bacterium]RLA60822.1 MAG: hypothetical protein DRR04_04645 [Gammaproteobacteria bacterium]
MHPNPTITPLAPLDYRLIVAVSLLLSAYLIAIDPLINRDAIIYLRSADAYLHGGFLASQQLFSRPLISICFALIHQLTGIPLVYAGQLLISLFYALFCAGFVSTVRTLGGDRRVQLIAAIVVLSQPILNDHRASIVRDPAYWAFIILAFRELLLFLRSPTWKYQLRWFVYMLFASVFRFEGLFFAMLAPLSLLAIKGLEHRGRLCLRLLAPALSAVGAYLVAVLVLHPGALPLPSIENYIHDLLSFPEQFARVTLASGEAMLRGSAKEDASVAVLAGLIAILLLNICRAFTWPYIVVLLWGWKKKLLGRFRSNDATLLQAHLLISLAYLALFTLINRFMLERYSNQFSIFALLYTPFILSALWRESLGHWKKIVVAGLLLGMSLDTLFHGGLEKVFIRDAKDWLVTNTSAHATLASNDKYIAYFSGREFDWSTANKNKSDMSAFLSSTSQWQERNYMAMRVRLRDTEVWEAFLKKYSLQEAAIFDGGSHGVISIVKINNVVLERPGTSDKPHY